MFLTEMIVFQILYNILRQTLYGTSNMMGQNSSKKPPMPVVYF